MVRQTYHPNDTTQIWSGTLKRESGMQGMFQLWVASVHAGNDDRGAQYHGSIDGIGGGRKNTFLERAQY